MKSVKILFIAGLLLLLCGCGKKGSSEDQPITKSGQPASSATPIAEETTVTPKTVKDGEKGVGLDEIFTVQLGETVTVNEMFTVCFSNIFQNENGTRHDIIFCAKDKAPLEFFMWEQNGEFWGASEIIDGYQLTMKETDHSSSVVFQMKELKRAKKSEMNGKREELYTTTENEYFESEKFILFVPKGISLEQDVLIKIKDIMNALENLTGWKFFAHDIGEKNTVYETYYGEDFYFDVDPEGKKIHICVVEDLQGKGWVSNAYENQFVYIYEEEYDKNTLSLAIILHELSHALHSYNIPLPSDSDTFSEGFANSIQFYLAEEMKDKYPDTFQNYLITSNIEKNSDGTDSPVTEETAEELFLKNYRTNEADIMQQRNYQIGGMVMTYFRETYGKEGFVQLLEEMNKKFVPRRLNDVLNDPSYVEVSINDYADALKKVFGEDFFKDFSKWFRENKAHYLLY